MKISPAKFTIRLTICAAALLLSNRFCFADTCPADVQARPSGNEETLAHQFQPPGQDGDILHRFRFVPPSPYAAPYPTVLMFPPDVFYLEYGDHGVPTERVATYNLQQAGFLVFQVDHRLAPPNRLPGQLSTGQAPEQTDDAKRQILAALADSQCNGTVYLIGGSAGGCLALWCGLASAPGAVTGWDNIARVKVKAVVSFSGVTDPSNWDHPGLTDAQYLNFETHVDNYVGLTYPAYDYATLYAASPVSLITTGAATSSPPVMLYASTLDSVSYVQADEMYNALSDIGAMVTETVFPGSDHAFYNWHKMDLSMTNCVSTDVINFLRSHP